MGMSILNMGDIAFISLKSTSGYYQYLLRKWCSGIHHQTLAALYRRDVYISYINSISISISTPRIPFMSRSRPVSILNRTLLTFWEEFE